MKILFADDQELVRDTIAAFLRHEPDIKVDVAADVKSALLLASLQSDIDLVLLDYKMPGMNGLQGLTSLKAMLRGVPVAILSGNAPRIVAKQAIAAGAAGFLPKSMSTKSLLAAIRLMAAGEIYAPFWNQAERTEVPQGFSDAQLTQRELGVLNRICQGMANKEIARELDIQEVTVKFHVKTLYRKISAKNRTHAAMLAREAGLV